METIDDEATKHALRFIDDAHEADKPFFLWYNTTGMHFRTHTAKKHEGKSGQGFYNDAMVAHDERIGQMLDKLDKLGIAEDTIVMYSTDNGPHYNSWPDAGITPFRAEKNTNWEGGWRVPAFVRWPGKFPAGSVVNGLVSHQDWLPTLLAAAGEPDVKEKLLKGHEVGRKTFNVHIDGYNLLPHLTGEAGEDEARPRNNFFAFVDDGSLGAVRYGPMKAHFSVQDHEGMDAWRRPQTV
jgi:arylsulfatase